MAYLAPLAISLLAVGTTVFLVRFRRPSKPPAPEPEPNYENTFTEPARLLRAKLASALPGAVVSPRDGDAYRTALDGHWYQQEQDVAPACFVRPADAKEVAVAVSILKEELERRVKEGLLGEEALFAVRGGGHSHVGGAASARGGVVIDLSRLDKITVSEDGGEVMFGAGVRYGNVFRAVEEKGRAVVGSRVECVGVGGFTTGSGYSFYSPQYGFSPSTMSSYEVVLASGEIVTASSTQNSDLWRALKGGSNNFGIVTRFTARTIPASNVWSGFTYHPYNQASGALSAFHAYVDRATNKGTDSLYDEHACGPITAFAYVQQLGMRLVAIHMAHTAPPKDGSWPTTWRTSHGHLWRLWSTCKLSDHKGASAQLEASNPKGKRHFQCTITVHNDAPTLRAMHAIWEASVLEFRAANVKNLGFSLGFQPLLQSWATKGDPNVLGLDPDGGPLVIVHLCPIWTEAEHDGVVHDITRRTMESMEKRAAEMGTGHRFRFTNYAGGWQDVMAGYGEEMVAFMRGVSARVDPEGLWQRGCKGGFKLGAEDE